MQSKGNQPIEIFLRDDPERFNRIKSQLQTSLKETAAVNATRIKMLKELFKSELPVEVSTGGKTKYNRAHLNIPKTHALHAACTGETPRVEGWNIAVLSIKAGGRGAYQRTRLDKYGFPRDYLTKQKKAKGFQTGDIVRASVTNSKKAGVHIGRVAIRANGSFDIQTLTGTHSRYRTQTLPSPNKRMATTIQQGTAIPPTAKQWVSSHDFSMRYAEGLVVGSTW